MWYTLTNLSNLCEPFFWGFLVSTLLWAGILSWSERKRRVERINLEHQIDNLLQEREALKSEINEICRLNSIPYPFNRKKKHDWVDFGRAVARDILNVTGLR